ncbi:hypothetical protein SAMN05660462_02272 [Proteiniborus ethanoligenes]|uniref:Radical SAM core domain-containing protein n=1 Tax=Proteiniborus ethanoligenes TaxID=415015 RepID=A0A1H3RBE6_9FIRM|nr:TIGR01212 family radical SAM protein [Proteiniborus ethanoligenes]TAH63863.1 MAG: TIGR01212 family radical SAM protein [Gottschalkiaceae bacterium]SDZ22279.1 hypothetical protein SAMN05660462_02272 [Proteiniborus ethanoligenes]
MEERNFYRVYSDYLREKYGTKVYKLPVNLPITCPNRDGCLGYGGCIFCGEEGAGFENLSNTIPVKEQLEKNMEYIKAKYKAEKFIAYFQNFSNTYMSLSHFKKYIKDAIIDHIVEISISTRPDCISDVYLEFLAQISEEHNINITIELGLQTVNYHTLKTINRGHSLAEFIDSVLRIKKYGFRTCAHIILNLPWDSMEDVIECAKILSALFVEEIKLHSLYVVENTVLGEMYKEGKVGLLSKEEYINRAITFLEYLHPDIIMQRIIGRAPEENTLFVNWNTSWWKIRDEIIQEMCRRGTQQGVKCNYLNGRALKNIME